MPQKCRFPFLAVVLYNGSSRRREGRRKLASGRQASMYRAAAFVQMRPTRCLYHYEWAVLVNTFGLFVPCTASKFCLGDFGNFGCRFLCHCFFLVTWISDSLPRRLNLAEEKLRWPLKHNGYIAIFLLLLLLSSSSSSSSSTTTSTSSSTFRQRMVTNLNTSYLLQSHQYCACIRYTSSNLI